ncbi:MAG: GTP-binding protein [Leptolyngbyaceae bacterium]|nr:GTP-binding protein [Leptolyngbyaceae bacterium]
MYQTRLVLILLSVLGLLIFVLWLTTTIAQLYASMAELSPTLAGVSVLCLSLILLGLVLALGYYGILLMRPRKRHPSPTAPAQATDAAVITLDAVQRHVNQIEDQMVRSTLLQRQAAIQNLMQQGDLQVVIVGVGSTGKTSTINAILGRQAGPVSAAMGTTTRSTSYRLQFEGMRRKILLTDTPGLLDASVGGAEWEEEARQIATEADLVLFVVENDLLQTEYDLLRQLGELGKRSLLLFNKTDLYPDEDRDAILNHLRQRVCGLLPPEDVVAIAANPTPVVLETGDRFYPEPDITALLYRVADILDREGETLMANNILLQTQRLGDEARKILDQQRRQQAIAIIEKYQWISGGVIAAMPLPGLDLLATAAINTQMVIEIGQVYGCEVNRERAKTLGVSLAKTLLGLGIVKGALELWSVTLKLNIATALIGQALQGVTGAYLTHIAGKSFIEYFRQEQTWGDGGMTDVVEAQFQLNRRDEFINAFIQQAMTNIVIPLTRSTSPSEAPTPSPADPSKNGTSQDR